MIGQDAASKLRYILENTNETVVAPGVYDGFSARIAHQVGFDALYMVLTPCFLMRGCGLLAIDGRWNVSVASGSC